MAIFLLDMLDLLGIMDSWILKFEAGTGLLVLLVTLLETLLPKCVL
jgi:hypothetical protein